MKRVSSKTDYEDIADEISHLREEKQKIKVSILELGEVKMRISDMNTFLQNQPSNIPEYDE